MAHNVFPLSRIWMLRLLVCATVLAVALLSPESGSARIKYVTVGVIGPLTTPSKSFGIGHLQGITLKAQEMNERLKEENQEWRIRLRVVDDKGKAASSVRGARLLEEAGVAAIFGPANSSATSAVIAEMEAAGKNVPIMSSLSTRTSLTEGLSYENFFRANISDEARINSLLTQMFRSKNGPRHGKLGIVYEVDDKFGEGLRDDAKAWLKKNEPKYLKNNTHILPYDRKLTKKDAREKIKKFNDLGIGKQERDAFLLLGLATDAVTFIRAIREKKLNAHVYYAEFNHLVFKQAFMEGMSARNLHVFSVWWINNKRLDSADRFKTSFENAFGEQPSFSAALAYDGAQILLWAIEKAFKEGLAPHDTQAFRTAVGKNIGEWDDPNLRFVLTGGHKFYDNEFKDLSLKSLGAKEYRELWPEIMDLNADIQRLQAENTVGTIEKPAFFILLLVFGFGYIGSVAREVSHFAIGNPNRRIGEALRKFVMPISLVVDPCIALIVFGSLLVVTIISFPETLSVGGDAETIYLYSSMPIGGLSGYLGIKALNAVLARLGIAYDDGPIASPPVAN